MKICIDCRVEKALVYFPERFGRGLYRESLSCSACNQARKVSKNAKERKKQHNNKLATAKWKIYKRRTYFRKVDNIPFSV